MEPFIYTGHPARVIFGRGTFAKLPAEIALLKIKKPLILSTPEQTHHATSVHDLLSSQSTKSAHPELSPAGCFTEAAMHTPMDVTLRALSFLRETGADGLVAIGGGSTTGLAKAIALQTDLPQVIVPTTYAGSEMTTIIGQTENGQKTTQKTLKVLPETVIYDVDFTFGLPHTLSAYSGMNAVAHAVEALYAELRNPIVDMMAIEGIRALVSSLPTILASPIPPADGSAPPSEELVNARTKAYYGAWLCANGLALVGMSLHHKLCHTLGGTFNTPHAETHTILLPHTLAYNLPYLTPEIRRKLVYAFGAVNESSQVQVGRGGAGESGDPLPSLNALMDALSSHGVLRGLKDLPMYIKGKETKIDVDKAAELATKNPYWNPRPIEREGIKELLRRAWEGEDARGDI